MKEQRTRLIEYLERLANSGYEVENSAVPAETTNLMLELIGDPDPYLRDELIYSTFHKWICYYKYYTDDELRALLSVVLDGSHLFFGIGNREDKSVFTRTFSALVVSLVLSRHRETVFLSAEQIQNTKGCLLEYCKSERDFRGYTADCGWAHSAAHCADALDELAQCGECDAAAHLEILNAILPVLFNGSTIFCHREDDRIGTIIHSIYQMQLVSSKELADWILCLSTPDGIEDYYARYVCRENARRFLRSLYFRAMRHGYDELILRTILDAEANLG